MTILSFIVGLVGALLVSVGVWLISPPAGLISGGVICLLWSYLNARAASDSPDGGE